VLLHYLRQAEASPVDAAGGASTPGESFYRSQQAKSADEVLTEICQMGCGCAGSPAMTKPTASWKRTTSPSTTGALHVRQQSLPPLRRPPAILQNKTSPYNDFAANGNNPLNTVSHPKGALQRCPVPRTPFPETNSGRREPLSLSCCRSSLETRLAEYENCRLFSCLVTRGHFYCAKGGDISIVV
jgi:hypothetical protein